MLGFASANQPTLRLNQIAAGFVIRFTAAALYLTQEDVNQGINEVAALGRDNDTTAALVGNIAGVIHGASAIRQDWIAPVEQGNADFFKEVEGDSNANFYSMAQ